MKVWLSFCYDDDDSIQKRRIYHKNNNNNNNIPMKCSRGKNLDVSEVFH